MALTAPAKVVDSGNCGERAERFLSQGNALLSGGIATDSLKSRQLQAQKYFDVAYDLCAEDSVHARVILPLAKTLVDEPSRLTALVSKHMATSQTPPSDSLLFLLGRAYFADNSALEGQEVVHWMHQMYPKSLLGSELEMLELRNHFKTNSISLLEWNIAGWTLENMARLTPVDPRLDTLRYQWALAPKGWKAYELADSLLAQFIVVGGPEDLVASARQERGALHALQGKLREAFALWQEYLDKHPRHSGWRSTLMGMEGMLFEEGLRLAKANQSDSAIAVWDEFAHKYPASDRLAQALVQKGEAQLALMHGAEAAVTFQDGISRFPASPVLKDLWYGLARAQELQRHYHDAEEALDKAVKAGSSQASEMLEAYKGKVLNIAGSRIQTIPSKGVLKILTRNVDSVEVRIFPVDAEDYFRSRFDFKALTNLDIALCKPTQRFIKKIPEAEPYRLLGSQVFLNLTKPGSYLVTVGAADYEGVTPVWISNLQVVLTSQGDELIALVRDKVKGQLVVGAKVLVSDGSQIVFEGVTGKDGILRHAIPVESGSNWQVLALQGNDASWASLENIQNVSNSEKHLTTPLLWTSLNVYHPLDTLRVLGVLWNKNNEKSAGEYRLELMQNNVRYWSQNVVLDSLSSFQGKYAWATAPAQGSFELKLWNAGTMIASKTLWVGESQNSRIKQWTVQPEKEEVLLGQPLGVHVTLFDEAGLPMAGQPVVLTTSETPKMPRRLGIDSIATILDAQGRAQLSFTPQSLVRNVTVELPNLGLQRTIPARVVAETRSLDLSLLHGNIRENDTVAVRVAFAGSATVELWQIDSLKREHAVWHKSIDAGKDSSQVLRIPGLKASTYKIMAKAAGVEGTPLVQTLEFHVEPRNAPLTWNTLDTIAVPGAQVHFHVQNSGAPTHAILTSVHNRFVDVQSVFLRTGSTDLALAVGDSMLPAMSFQLTAIQGDSMVQLEQHIQVSRQLQVSASWQSGLRDGDSVTLHFQVKDAMGRPTAARLFVTSFDNRALQIHQGSWSTYPLSNEVEPAGFTGLYAQSGLVWFDSVLAERIEAVKIVESTSNDGSNALESKRKMMTAKGAAESDVEGWKESPSAEYVLNEGGSGGIGDMLGGLMGGSSGSLATRASGRIRVPETLLAYYPFAAITATNLQADAKGQVTLRLRLPVGVATEWRTQVVALGSNQQLGILDTSLVVLRNQKNADWQVPALVHKDLWPRTMDLLAAEYANGTVFQRQSLRVEGATLLQQWSDLTSQAWFWSLLTDLPSSEIPNWLSRSQMEQSIREAIAANNINGALFLCRYAASLDQSVVPQEVLLRLQRNPQELGAETLARLSLVWKALQRDDMRAELKPFVQSAFEKLGNASLTMNHLLLLEALDGGTPSQAKPLQQLLRASPGAAPDIQFQALRLWKDRSLLPNTLPLAVTNAENERVGVRFQVASPLPSRDIPIGYDGAATDTVVPSGRLFEMRIPIPDRSEREEIDWIAFPIPEGLQIKDARAIVTAGRCWIPLNPHMGREIMRITFQTNAHLQSALKIPVWEYVEAGSLAPQALTAPSLLRVQSGVERAEKDLSPTEQRALVVLLRDIKDNKTALRLMESAYKVSQQASDLDTLLQISIALGEPKAMVKYFELAKERHPDLMIPFTDLDKLLDAYKSLNYKEATALFEKGLRNARFQSELIDIGKFKQLGNVQAAWSTMNDLLRKHAGHVELNKPRYHFAQLLYQYVDDGADLDTLGSKRWLQRVIDLLEQSLASKPKDDYGPSAIYTLATAYLELGNTAAAIAWCDKGLAWYPKSEETHSISYLRAFATFRKGDYNSALELCSQIVKDQKMDEESIQMATYIMAQIYHARGEMDKALPLYRKVDFADAREVVRNADRRYFKVPTSLTLPLGALARVPVEARNVASFDMRIYSVDPLKMVQRKGTIDNLGDLNFAGIQPLQAQTVKLSSQAGVNLHKDVDLGALKNGAYLLLLRTDREVRQTLCVLGALDVELDRVNTTKVRIVAKDDQGKPLPGALVQVKGSENDFFTTGRTDARGIFSADSLQGTVQGLVEFNGRYGIAQESHKVYKDAEDEERDKQYQDAEDSYDDTAAGEETSDGMIADEPAPNPAMKRQASFEDQDYFDNDVKGMAVNDAM